MPLMACFPSRAWQSALTHGRRGSPRPARQHERLSACSASQPTPPCRGPARAGSGFGHAVVEIRPALASREPPVLGVLVAGVPFRLVQGPFLFRRVPLLLGPVF